MKKILFLLLVVAGFWACSTLKNNGVAMPVPEDLKITYSREGGYAPRFEKCILSKEKCSYSYEFGKKKYAFDFVISEKEFNTLYEALKRNNFESIEESDKRIYDHIYERIDMEINDRFFSKTDNAGIALGSVRNWENCLAAITKIIEKEKKIRNVVTY